MAQKLKPKSRVLLMIAIALVMVILGVVLALALSQPERVVSSIPLVLEPQMTYEVVNAFPHDPDSFTRD